MKVFECYEEMPEMRPCMKKPMVVHAVQINEEFRVKSMEGDYAQGKVGDYLMKGIDGECYICEQDIYNRTYGWL